MRRGYAPMSAPTTRTPLERELPADGPAPRGSRSQPFADRFAAGRLPCYAGQMRQTNASRSRSVPRPLTAAACLVFVACTGGGEGPDAGADGPCVHELREPVLHIASAEPEDAGDPLAELELWDVTIDDEAESLESVLSQWPDDDTGLELSEGEERLICTIPCAMGMREGAWSFQATAGGHGTTTVTADAEYGVHEGGCPSYSDDGTRIDVELPPE